MLGIALSAHAGCRPPAPELPSYAIRLRLQPVAPRLTAEATVTIPVLSSQPAAFVLAEMFTLESVEVLQGGNAHSARMDSTMIPGSRPGWGNIRWQIQHGNEAQTSGRPLSLRVRYRLDTAATALVFGVDDSVVFASGINAAWYPQIEDGPSSIPGRVRTKRGTGTLEVEVPDGVTVYALGTAVDPSTTAQNGRRYAFKVETPAYFNFAAARFHLEQSPSVPGGTPSTATFSLRRRNTAGSYVAKSLAVLRTLTAEFGDYPFPRFALVEVPAALAERAGFAGASADGAIFTTSEYLDQPFNAAYYGHEIAHQWWGVTIRPSGPRGGWMWQEGMAQYGGLRAVEALDGPDGARTFRQREYPGYFGQGGELYFRTVAAGHDAPLADLPAGAEWARDIADSKGFMSLNALANEMGRDRVRAAFREVLREFRDRRLSWDDFLAVLSRAASRDLSWFSTQWFERTGAPELVADLGNHRQEIRLRQVGDLYRLTVELAVFGVGCRQRLRTTISALEARVPLPGGCRADSVTVDPDYQILRWTPELRARYRKQD